MALSGTLINCILIITGALAGLLFKKIMSERLKSTLLQAVGLIVMFVGIGGAVSEALTFDEGAFGTKNTLNMILSMVLGTIIGELINIEKRLDTFGAFCQKKLVKGDGKSTFGEGLVTASLIFCVGAMAVGTVAGCLFHICSNELAENGLVAALAIVTGKINHWWNLQKYNMLTLYAQISPVSIPGILLCPAA